ncbi:hypothetical protein BpHYR1_001893 [Brachionus plicatilis]|uniref:Uncharacterized protein n=1 Tax=Brachionus plicatilis TaxID=10195 RepID=A0A3M7SIT2_BRAPC|nr:hypothetical protein BpHYR1_001893 [Brachionus plicatilis]
MYTMLTAVLIKTTPQMTGSENVHTIWPSRQSNGSSQSLPAFLALPPSRPTQPSDSANLDVRTVRPSQPSRPNCPI